jgi:HAD superfamily hydrolase (TIGR01509 family)
VEPVTAAEHLRALIEGKRAVIFDFDNIIADSEPYHYRAYATVFARKGHTVDREEYWIEWTSKGGGAEGEIERYGLDLDPDDIRREKDPIYSAFCSSGEIPLFPESREIIGRLRGAGYTLAIASGSYERDIRSLLRLNGIEDAFSAVIGKDGIARVKPHPETYVKAAREIQTDPALCIAIEDAEKGVRSAREAGMSVILIDTPITAALGITGADLRLPGLTELSALLRVVLPEQERDGPR